MHILQIVCTDAFAGTERHVLTTSLGLRAAGHDVTVIGGSEAHMHEPLARVGVPWRAGAGLRAAVSAARRTAGVDVIATHLSSADLAGVIVSGVLGAPVVSTRHMGQRRGSGAARRTALRWAARRISEQIAVSSYVAAHVEGPSTVIHSGVATADDTDRPREKRVLLAQRLEAEKQTDTVLRAWELLGADAAGWRLEIAGDGAERLGLEALASRLGVRATVDFVGHRPDVPARMRAASVFVATAPAEHYGLAVLEAMANGTAVVATAAGGHLETVGRLPGAALFPPADAAALADALARLIADPAQRVTYGGEGRALQRADFSIDRQVARTLAVYERAVAG